MNERDYAVKVKLKMHVEKGINDNWQTITKIRKEMRIAEHIKNIFEEDGMLSNILPGIWNSCFIKHVNLQLNSNSIVPRGVNRRLRSLCGLA